MQPVVLRRETLSSGYIKLARLTIRLESGANVQREVESHGAAVAILPYDPDRRRALVVRLFRAPPFDSAGLLFLEEACAGMIDPGDIDDEATVRREAHEELGLRVGALEFVARIWPSPGVSTETAALYLAPYAPADRVGPGGGLASENEDITVVERTLAELADDADHGRIADGKLLTLVLALRVRRPDLFLPPSR
jgi:nudix-type nucleoside diphosphatase (YffH/AdpP family)